MSPPATSSRVWLLLPLLAAGVLVTTHFMRGQRIDYVTHAVANDIVTSRTSSTGYAGGLRNLILPEPAGDSYHWIAQTEQMLATGEWRIRHLDYENAPQGRLTLTPSPYRWWLGLIAWADYVISDRPLGQSVERAALIADPLLHLLLLVVAVIFAARHFGNFPAALLALAVVGLFPFASGFVPGIPDDKSFARVCACLSILVLLPGLRGIPKLRDPNDTPSPHPRLWFVLSGVIGALGLWVSPAVQVPVILGLVVGGLASGWSQRKTPDALTGPWLAWSLGGAISSLAFYLVEYFPSHLGAWRLQEIHPLYSLSWLGLGILLTLVAHAKSPGPFAKKSNQIGGGLFAGLSIAALPLTMWFTNDHGFLAVDSWSYRLTRLPGSDEATHLGAWLAQDGVAPTLLATVLPLLVLFPAVWLLLRRDTAPTSRHVLVLVLGPVLTTMLFACWQIGRWSNFDATWLVLLVAIVWVLTETFRSSAWKGLACAALLIVMLPGLVPLRPRSGSTEQTPLNESELSALVVRDLAHWLSKRTAADRAVILAPPNETAALYYYGGLRGIGTLSWENQAGIGAAVRILSATSMAEALALLSNRQVTHLVIPSWDRYLPEYVRLGVGQGTGGFLGELRSWSLPPWLRAVPYQLPNVPGYEGHSVAIFELVEEQDDATALSRLAEYFIEMGNLPYAAAISQSLQQFPADMGAWIARAQVAMAHRHGADLTEALAVLVPKIQTGADRYLPWDRRISLAVALAQGKETELAREQVRRCLAEANETKLRSATTASLYRLLLLAKMFQLEIAEPHLRSLARDLLPNESRQLL